MGDEGEKRSFEDRWSGGMQQYISWLHERVSEMHRVLKKTGSIYLHCDWHADAYIRVQILDPIFGEKNFRNEIVWCYNTGGRAKNHFPKKHDTVFYYSKSNEFNFNYNGVALERDTSTMHEPILFDSKGKAYQRNVKNGKEYKYYLDVGVLPNSWWTDIQALNPSAKERIGYPTQKPEALLERIIKASSNKGDIILDPFLGGGTTISVAEKLGRKWIGIDQSMIAVKVSEGRMLQGKHLFSSEFILEKSKYEYEYLFDKSNGMKDLEFEKFIVQKFGGEANVKQIGDFGIDGRDATLRPIQVKRSEGIGRNIVDESAYDFERYFKSTTKLKELKAELIKKKLPIGTIIAFSFGKGAVEEVARLKQQEGIIIELKKVSEIVEMAKKPKIKIAVELGGEGKNGEKLVKFVCTSEEKIEVWQFDFAFDEEKGFKPSILNGKGEEEESFKEGYYCIAIKGITDFGLEAIESFKIKINGDVVKV